MPNLRQKNGLIQSMAPKDRKAFVADLDCVDIHTLDVISGAGSHLANTCFPAGSVISMLYSSSGRTMEVHAVGREGMLTNTLLRPEYQTRFDFKCQISGSMLYMPHATFEQHLLQNDALQRAVSSYSASVVNFLAQSVACAGLHSVAQRCARCLLVTIDRVNSLQFALTHELIASMLGVRRSGVSVALNQLAQLKIVHYRLGEFTVLDRDALLRQACECYRVVARRSA